MTAVKIFGEHDERTKEQMAHMMSLHGFDEDRLVRDGEVDAAGDEASLVGFVVEGS